MFLKDVQKQQNFTLKFSSSHLITLRFQSLRVRIIGHTVVLIGKILKSFLQSFNEIFKVSIVKTNGKMTQQIVTSTDQKLTFACDADRMDLVHETQKQIDDRIHDGTLIEAALLSKFYLVVH